MPKLFILGTGGLAKEAAQLARRIDSVGERWPMLAYVSQHRQTVGAHLPHGNVEYADDEFFGLDQQCDVLIAIGNPAPRKRLAERAMRNEHFAFPNLVHPGVEIDTAVVRLGMGNMICKGVVMTCDIAIGDFNLLNWNVTVGHDATIGSFNVINPSSNISGNTRIGDACLVGSGAQILERLVVASQTTVGAGAVVTSSIQTAGVYVGVPARLRR